VEYFNRLIFADVIQARVNGILLNPSRNNIADGIIRIIQRKIGLRGEVLTPDLEVKIAAKLNPQE